MEEVLEIWTVELLKEPGDLKNEVVTYCIYDKKKLVKALTVKVYNFF